MKKIISSLAIATYLFSTPVTAEVYYCSSDDAVGFDLAENYKQYNYKDQRFQVKIDWQQRTMDSEKIYLKGGVKCIYEEFGNTLYCLSEYGTTLAVSRETLKFHFSTMFLKNDAVDDMVIYHGNCEIF